MDSYDYYDDYEDEGIGFTTPLLISFVLGIYLVYTRYHSIRNRAIPFYWPPPDVSLSSVPKRSFFKADNRPLEMTMKLLKSKIQPLIRTYAIPSYCPLVLPQDMNTSLLLTLLHLFISALLSQMTARTYGSKSNRPWGLSQDGAKPTSPSANVSFEV